MNDKLKIKQKSFVCGSEVLGFPDDLLFPDLLEGLNYKLKARCRRQAFRSKHLLTDQGTSERHHFQKLLVVVVILGADVLGEGAGHVLGSGLFFVARFKLQEVKHDLIVEVLVCFD